MSLGISRELLDQARSGSPEALNHLYERCAGRLLAFIRLRLGRDLRSRLESRDILQATLLKSLEHVAELKADETRSALSRVILGEQAERLEAALESLSPSHREIILLRKFEELSFAEIGQRLGKTEDACRMVLARAMTALTVKMSEIPR